VEPNPLGCSAALSPARTESCHTNPENSASLRSSSSASPGGILRIDIIQQIKPNLDNPTAEKLTQHFEPIEKPASILSAFQKDVPAPQIVKRNILEPNQMTNLLFLCQNVQKILSLDQVVEHA
jgi:hypothetical protein